MNAIREKVLILPCEPVKVTPSGIHIPDTLQVRPNKGVVVSVGKGLNGRPSFLEKGDIVYHVKGAGQPFEIDGKMHYMMIDADILCFQKN